MSPSLFEVFTAALQYEDPADQEQYLRESYQNDAAKLQEALGLLQAHYDSNSSDSFETPFAVLPQLESAREAVEEEETFPRAFGDYQLQGILGSGGMGVVYRAVHQKLNRQVALKVIRNSQLATRQQLNRFRAEAQAAAALDHPGIVPVFEVGEISRQHFFTMGLVEGMDLAEAVRSQKLGIEKAVEVIGEVAIAVAHAHEHGIIHRDLKPENILLTEENCSPRIADFGLATQMNRESGLTLDGAIIGTPDYMAPEQAAGGVVGNPALADVYSIGALLYFCLTGRPPFEGGSALAVLKKLQEDQVVNPGSLVPNLPRELEVICLKCLEKKPADRYASAQEIAIDLENYRAHRPLLAKPAGPISRFLKLCQRRKAGAIAALLAVLLILVAGIFSSHIKRLTGLSDGYSQELDDVSRSLEQRQVRSDLAQALNLVGQGKEEELSRRLHEVIALAQLVDDSRSENLARYQLGALDLKLWKRDSAWDLPANLKLARLSPDGRDLALLTQEGNFVMMNLTTGVLGPQVRLSPNTESVAFHPAGKLIVSADAANLVIWKRENEELKKIETLASLGTRQLAFNIDGSLLAQTTSDSILLWDFKLRKRTRSPLLSRGEICTSLIAEESNLICALSKSAFFTAWDLNSGQIKIGPVQLDGPLKEASLSSDGSKLLIYGDQAQSGYLYDLTQPTPVKRGELPRGLSMAIFGRRSNRLLNLNEGGFIRFGSSSSLKTDFATDQLFLGHDEESLLTLHHEAQKLIIWKVPHEAYSLARFGPSKAPGVSLGASKSPILISDGRRIKITPSPRDLGQSWRRFHPPRLKHVPGQVLAVTHAPNEECFVLYENGRSHIERFEVSTKQTRWISAGLDHSANQCVLSPSGKFLIAYTRDSTSDQGGVFSILETGSHEVSAHQLEFERLQDFVFANQEESVLIIATKNQGLLWYDFEARKVIRREEKNAKGVNAMAISSNYERLILGRQDGNSRLFQVKGWRPLSPVISHSGPVTLLAFADDDRLAISASHQGGVKIWEAQSGQLIGTALKHEAPVASFHVCSETHSLHTLTENGSLRIWPLPGRE